eukprot:TRINITY_DN131_c4_g1_i1.p1 TRINITY_DN131_c4_g1~~TRINITY_DN131_c4_g1_i1.p1  ORF type:complete len:591 (+),score=111.60 TRINITY_DN131_c4_g1_i1:171-1943(+)
MWKRRTGGVGAGSSNRHVGVGGLYYSNTQDESIWWRLFRYAAIVLAIIAFFHLVLELAVFSRDHGKDNDNTHTNINDQLRTKHERTQDSSSTYTNNPLDNSGAQKGRGHSDYSSRTLPQVSSDDSIAPNWESVATGIAGRVRRINPKGTADKSGLIAIEESSSSASGGNGNIFKGIGGGWNSDVIVQRRYNEFVAPDRGLDLYRWMGKHPSDEREVTHDLSGGGEGLFNFVDPREELSPPAHEFGWCNPTIGWHKGGYSKEACTDFMAFRVMGLGQGQFHVDKRRDTIVDVVRTQRHPKYRIASIVPWAGSSFPDWMTYFLTSCSANADIADWLFLVLEGQFAPPAFLPANVKLIWVKNWGEFFTSRLGMKFSDNDDNRKFADIKPCYGAILEKELKDYSHWAFVDIDMIMGKISRMVEDWELEFYDVISFQGHDASHPFNSGPFTIFKNTEFGRTFWKAPEYWDKPHPYVSHEGPNWAFDESLSAEVLFSYDNVRILHTIGRLFNDLCSTPRDYSYTFRNGILRRHKHGHHGTDISEDKKFVEEGLALHFGFSKMMQGITPMARTTVDPAVPFNITLWPAGQLANVDVD